MAARPAPRPPRPRPPAAVNAPRPKAYSDPLVGKTVAAVRPLTDAEMAVNGWAVTATYPYRPVGIFFPDGTYLVASEDPARRNVARVKGDYRPGTLVGVGPDGQLFRICTQ